MNGSQKWSKYLRICSLVLFIAALILPTHCTNVECSGFGAGLEAFAMGWLLALFKGSAATAWFANPFYFLAFFTARKEPVVAIVGAGIALFIARTFLDGGELLLNEAGHTAYITSIEIGFWVWLGSMVAILLSAVLYLNYKIQLKKIK